MSTATNKYVEIHLLQSFPASNLNRDAAGNPKEAPFGGVRRARISSQCLKRAIRTAPVFAEQTGVPLGWRSRYMMDLLRQRLEGKDATEVARVLNAFVPFYFGKLDEEKGRAATAAFFSAGELGVIAEALLSQWTALVAEAVEETAGEQEEGAEPQTKKGKGKKKANGGGDTVTTIAAQLIKQRVGWTDAPDIALFGRMMAHDPTLEIAAACQVAPAISVHRHMPEQDFYTALDDFLGDEASMLGSTAYTSAVFYRYARVDWDLLCRNLNGDTQLAEKTLRGFLHATLVAVPTGKQNSFAAFNLPELALGIARQGGVAWNLSNAFETPITPLSGGGLMTPAVQALLGYYEDTVELWGKDSILGTALTLQRRYQDVTGEAATTVVPNMNDWVQTLVQHIISEE